jgi:hypothetical protein
MKRVAQDGFDEIQYAQRQLAVRFNPVAQILDEFGKTASCRFLLKANLRPQFFDRLWRRVILQSAA